jgi:PAS domain S-box-containing protein
MRSVDLTEPGRGNVLPISRAGRDADEREAWFRDLLEALPVAIYTTDAEGRITFFNRAAVDLAGVAPRLGVDQWCVSARLYYPDGTVMPHDQCPMAVALKTGEPVRGAEAVAERPDGSRVPFVHHPTPLKDADGRIVGAVSMLVDISERKRAEEQQKVLIDEVNHRVKNTLAVVQSLAFQSVRSAGASESSAATFEGRLMALSLVHELLAGRGWTDISLHEILSRELQDYAQAEPGRVRLDGPMISLTPRMAVAFGMITHELAANALRHGSLGVPEGRAEVSWRIDKGDGDAGDELVLGWVERDGPRVHEPEALGFGLRLLERTVQGDLAGRCELSFPPAGARCEIRAPLGGPSER